MEASVRKILTLLSTPNTKFVIPVYQRNYDWDEKQCSVLLKDIMDVASDDNILSHFLGSIVYFHEGVYTTGKNELSIIDGQQRLTTITLLLIALYHKSKEIEYFESGDIIFDQYLTYRHFKDTNKMKLVATEKNENILFKVLEERFDDISDDDDKSNILKNYNFFVQEIMNKESIDKINKGIEKLIYVDIALEKEKDDSQRIFESLNSTGLDLSQGDLIRNFILMNLDRENQNYIYQNYWIPIEEYTTVIKDKKIKIFISEFIRDFLTLQFGKIPNKTKVFEEFKNNYRYVDKSKLEFELKKIKEYASIYNVILNPEKEKDLGIQKQLKYLKSLDQGVINPFILGIYYDYKNNKICKDILIKVIELIQSYLWRRYITGEKTNVLNKIFMNLYSRIDDNRYYDSIEEYLARQNFPNDEKLKAELKIKQLYKDKEKLNYLFDRIENYGHHELVDVYSSNITIEHIFPQKPDKSWKNLLSESEFEKMVSLRDTISNLTLTGSNSNLGNKSFIEKKNIPVYGYKDSKLYLNKWLAEQDEWNLNKMDERFNKIFQIVINIWKYTKILNTNYYSKEIIFYCQGPRGYGTCKLVSDKITILKGSKASKFLYDSVKESNEKEIKQLIEKGVLEDKEEFYVFTNDYNVGSPSAAAKLVLGRSANGWSEWKTYEGKPLSDFRNKK